MELLFLNVVWLAIAIAAYLVGNAGSSASDSYYRGYTDAMQEKGDLMDKFEEVLKREIHP